MFTGIVQGLAKVSSIQKTASIMRYSLVLPRSLCNAITIGASISVEGVCQTVVGFNEETAEVAFEAIEQTLRCTTLDHLTVGDWVNIERSAKIGDEIGGHLMSGHIIGTATIEKCETFHGQRTLTLRCPVEWMKYILPKGFIGLNGASLTVGETSPEGKFSIYLIPETLKQTTFGQPTPRDKVNVEISSQTQLIVDTVERILIKNYHSNPLPTT